MKLKFLVYLLTFIFGIMAFGQIPTDLRKSKSTDFTDAQLQEFVQKAATSGLSEAQIMQELEKRGMLRNEIDLIKSRITVLNQQSAVGGQSDNVAPSGNSVQRTSSMNNMVLPSKSNTNPAIFGSELFSNPSLSFEPDLRIATPQNYVVGTSDKLLLDVYGINLSQQTLEISPEGTVNVKYAGPIYINGLTIEEASKRINIKLAKFYPAIKSGQTKAELTLTGIRSIKVILVGAVKKPGAYTLSSLATLFNALFVSGGPADNGSYRNIELVRNNKPILIADLYEFLLNADQKSNVNLKDNDVIRIPFVTNSVSLNGEVNRPAIFEVQLNENLETVIKFAGGYKSGAYKARITGIRLTDFEKKVIDIPKDSITLFKPQNGDVYNIGTILERFQNRISIEGAVFKPGIFSYENAMTVSSLLNKAEGLKEDAYTGRIIIIRTRENLTKEYINLNIAKDSLGNNFLLKKDDIVQVSSIFDIRDQFVVTINGAVRRPGVFVFEDSLSLKSLILKAGGFTDNATGMGITIARRKKDVEVNNPNSPIVDVIEINDAKDLNNGSADFTLKPFDIVSIKVNPYYKDQISVAVNGEVLLPGTFSLLSRVEKISDLIKRAGGTLYTANIAGARLRRKNNLYDVDLKVVKKIAESSAKDSSGVTVETERKPYMEIAIDLPRILANPGSKEDILLEEGDAIYIPTINNMISVSGEVFKPLEISYDDTKTLKDYLSDAGGVTNSANKKKIFVVYPNGKAARIKHTLLFFKKYPQITAGAKIFVPKEPEKKGTDYARVGLVITGVSALITAVALAYQISR